MSEKPKKKAIYDSIIEVKPHVIPRIAISKYLEQIAKAFPIKLGIDNEHGFNIRVLIEVCEINRAYSNSEKPNL